MRCRSLLVALSLLAVASSSTAVASALEGSAPGHPTAGLDIATLDARIEKAQAHIDRWYPRIERWYRHIRRAAARVDRLEELAPASSIVADGAGSLGRSHRQDPAFRLAEANRELRDTLRSSRARRAQRQLDAWSAVLAELVSAREGALRPPPAVRDPAPRALRGRPVTYEGWAAAFLGRLGAPGCGENLLIVVAWATAESTSAAFNPLATTRDMPGDSDFNTVGVKSYASMHHATRCCSAPSRTATRRSSTACKGADRRRSPPGRSTRRRGAGGAWGAPMSPACCRSCVRRTTSMPPGSCPPGRERASGQTARGARPGRIGGRGRASRDRGDPHAR
jgi:hypothetical protein